MSGKTAQRTVKRLLLGHQLRHLRDQRGVTQAQLGRLIDKGQAAIALVENGEKILSPTEFEILLHVLEVRQKDRAYLKGLHLEAQDVGNWNTGFRRAYSPSLRLFIDLEDHASRILSYCTEIVPGLLQHPAYTTALCERRTLRPDVTVEELVDAWTKRQRNLVKRNAPDVHYVLSESCLRRRWAPEEVMREQMGYLLSLAQLPSVTIQVLSFDTYMGSGPESFLDTSEFCLVQVPSPGPAGPLNMALSSGLGDLQYGNVPGAVTRNLKGHATAQSLALSPQESANFIRRLRDE